MKLNRILKEQATQPTNNDRDKLYKALQAGCFPQWITNGQFGKIAGKSVYYGKNSKGEDIVFYADMTAQNMKTKEKRSWVCEAITNNPLLSTFGIDSKLDKATLTKTLDNVTTNLQSYVDKEGVSNIFKQWNDLLISTYPDAIKLVITDDNLLPDNDVLTTRYTQVPGLDRDKGWKNAIIYLPKGKTKDLQAGKAGGITLDKENCKAILGQYLGAALQYNAKVETTPIPQLREFQQQLVKCDGAGQFDDFNGFDEAPAEVKKKLRPHGFLTKRIGKRQVFRILAGKTDSVKAPSPYIIGLNESTESNIKSLIKENLTKVKTEKLRTYSAESKIVKGRASIIVESTILKTKPQQRKLFNDILTESIYLNSQGFSKHIVQEQFFDTLKGFFDKEDFDSIYDTFKQYMGEWLVSKLTPLHADGWMSKLIMESIQDVDVNDFEKLLDCSFLTKSISKSIVDGSVGKLNKDNDLDGGLYDMVRNNIFDYVNNNDFLNKLESDITKILCPLLNGVSEKLDNAHEEIRDKAMSN